MALAAGLLALCLQLAAQVMPAEAMQGAMRAAALTSDDAQSFAATCLGFTPVPKGAPAKSDRHRVCPVCFTLAQVQGFAAPAIDLAPRQMWPGLAAAPLVAFAPIAERVAAAFDSQAPPADSIA